MRQLEGAILVGGKSSRMGRDKASILLGGRSILARIASAMAPLVTRLRVVGGSRGPTAPDSAALEWQPDLHPGLGPLAGIHAALKTARSERVLIVACDLPFVSTACLEVLAERAANAAFDAVVPRSNDRFVPVCAIYDIRCLEELEQRLARQDLSAQAFVRAVETSVVDVETWSAIDPSGRCLFNLNTPDDLESAVLLTAYD